MATRIAVFVFPGAEELDFVGPWEVLTMWAKSFPQDEAEVFMLGRDAETVTCAKGMKVVPQHTWDTAPGFDVLVFPGGEGNMPQLTDEAMLSWLRKSAERGATMTSVCTGALVFAAAGLLDSKPATTHWAYTGMLNDYGKDVDVRAEERFVDNGNVITAAGVSAGIDMALHLVARLHSPERAADVRRFIQYDPQPPV